ncbi:unnamed protein product, partial [Prorocentrum cordatum]
WLVQTLARSILGHLVRRHRSDWPQRTVRRAPPARKPSPPSSAANSEQERWDKRERESWPTLAAARRPTVAAWRRQLPSRILVDFCGRTRYKEEEEEEEEEASRT